MHHRKVRRELGGRIHQGNEEQGQLFRLRQSSGDQTGSSAGTTGKVAAQRAGTGALVVAGLKSSDHNPARSNGHVVIVVGGALYRETYPLCWCGSIGSAQSKGTKSVGEVWSRTDRDSVVYFCSSGIPSCPAS
jgi:hypothetical protein